MGLLASGYWLVVCLARRELQLPALCAVPVPVSGTRRRRSGPVVRFMDFSCNSPDADAALPYSLSESSCALLLVTTDRATYVPLFPALCSCSLATRGTRHVMRASLCFPCCRWRRATAHRHRPATGAPRSHGRTDLASAGDAGALLTLL